MKFTIEIPDGDYCCGCLMMGSHDENPYCNYAEKELEFDVDKCDQIKDADCPSKMMGG
jgi:hypothetical protein